MLEAYAALRAASLVIERRYPRKRALSSEQLVIKAAEQNP